MQFQRVSRSVRECLREGVNEGVMVQEMEALWLDR